MSKDPLFKGHEVISNHGTSSGIIPRFFNQIYDIAKHAYGKEETDRIFDEFLKLNIPDFTHFHDLYIEIVVKYENYKKGLENGKYFSINEKGQFRLDRSLEFDFQRKIKDFYILGRLLLNNFSKSKIIDSEYFILNNFLLVNDKNFEKQKQEYYKKDPGKKFEKLIEVLEQGRKECLNTFNQIRADIEHKNLEIPKFKIDTSTGEYQEIGLTEDSNLLEELHFCYRYILDMLEALMIYYFGILATERSTMLGVFMKDKYNFSKMDYRFIIFPRVKMDGHTMIL